MPRTIRPQPKYALGVEALFMGVVIAYILFNGTISILNREEIVQINHKMDMLIRTCEK